ncbi:MAG: hypothetical protein ACO1OB_27280 [Archangium sp.]
MIHVRLPAGIEQWEPEQLLPAMNEGRVDQLTPVSFDAGETWTSAAAAVKRIGQKRVGTEAVSVWVPKGWDIRAAYALWVGLFWGFFFAVPIALLGGMAGARNHLSAPVELLVMLGAWGSGPLAMLVLGLIARSGVKKSGLRGEGVAWFCFIMFALTTVELFAVRAVR